jgi:hypothetical protein
MTERLGECWECEAQNVPVFSEGDGFGRDYCARCTQRCVFCKGYCDSYGCANDEGEINFDVHDCLVDGKVTCLGNPAVIDCKYRYCLDCTEKCSVCDFNIVIKGSGPCKDCA